MTVRDLYRILALSPKSIEVQFYDEQHNEYDCLPNMEMEEYEVLYIKDWKAETREPNALEPYNFFNSSLCLSIVIAPPKAVIEARKTIDEIYNSMGIKDERFLIY